MNWKDVVLILLVLAAIASLYYIVNVMHTDAYKCIEDPILYAKENLHATCTCFKAGEQISGFVTTTP